MKKKSVKKILLLTVTGYMVCLTAIAQKIYHSQVIDIVLTGTSNVHDWEMKAVAGESEVAFKIDAKGIVTDVSTFSFKLPAKNLKSNHNGMDKNTYKALKTDSNPMISFTGISAVVTAEGQNKYQLSCLGKMSIAGTTKQTSLLATGVYDPADKSFTITGIKKMKMTDYNVKPPKALLGTIKTGDDIAISYNVKFRR